MERQARENAAPLICPHCGQKIVASQSNLSAASQAIRENASMSCPFCGREFYLTDKAALEQTNAATPVADFRNVDIAGDEDPENDE